MQFPTMSAETNGDMDKSGDKDVMGKNSGAKNDENNNSNNNGGKRKSKVNIIEKLFFIFNVYFL